MAKNDNKSTAVQSGSESKPEFALHPENYKYLAIGFVVIILGFILMSGGGTDDPNVFNEAELFSFRRVTLAPIVILAGFIFEIWAIMRTPKSN